MKLIKPKQISGEIMTLLDEADEKVIIISPYAQTKNWTKLQNTFDGLVKRNIPIEFYYRKGEVKTKKEIESLNIEAIPIENLHCKIYMNEKTAIVSSMNLYEYSDNNSLDIAHKTETEEELSQLKDFYVRYIEVYNIEEDFEINESDFLMKLDSNLGKKLFANYSVYLDDDGEIIIQYWGNRYHFITKNDGFEIIGILSQNEFNFANRNFDKYLNNDDIKYELINNGFGNYCNVISKLNLKSNSFNSIKNSEVKFISNTISTFLDSIRILKEGVYQKFY